MTAYNSSYTGAEHDAYVSKTALVDLIYPVGSIYMSVNTVSPATLFGGTWEQINGKFLLAQDDNHTANSTGGAETINLQHLHTTGNHALTIAEMPQHGHIVYVWDNAGATGNAYYRNGASIQTHSGARLYNDSASTWIAPGSTAAAAVSGQGDPSGGTNFIGSGANHNHGNTGNALSTTQSIMPPYLAVYMWKRTA